MSEHNPGGDPTQASGEPNKEDKVAYETYRKVLGEKKRRDEEVAQLSQRLTAYETEKKEREEAELKAKENFKQLLELREKELADEKTKRTTLEKNLLDGMKLNAFLKTLGGKVDEAYFGLIDLEQIAVDPTTNMPDMNSVQNMAREFEKKHHRIIDKATGVGLPNQAAGSANGTLTVDEWKKLPLKEMKARLKEVKLV